LLRRRRKRKEEEVGWRTWRRLVEGDGRRLEKSWVVDWRMEREGTELLLLLDLR